MTETKPSVAEFMAGAHPKPMNGSSAWSARYAEHAKRVVTEFANNRPRSLQKKIGPSGYGVPCDRQGVADLLDLTPTNHVFDPWAAWVGTCLHEGEAAAFAYQNLVFGQARYATELRVEVDNYLGGSSDLYDGGEQAVIDHKNLGATTLAKLRTQGPSQVYFLQLLAYGRGVRNLGLPVKRIAIIGWPRTESTLDNLYVWDHVLTPGDDVLLDAALARLRQRLMMADLIEQGHLSIEQIPITPSDDGCFFCRLYRPQSAYDGGPGCPGNRIPKTLPDSPSGAPSVPGQARPAAQ